MVRLWKTFSLPRSSSPYQLTRLVDERLVARPPSGPGLKHIVCDLDKTYLETEFESIVRMARIAFEDAVDKVTVTGASDVLLAARWGDPDLPLAAEPEERYPRALHFVSSSPPQLRSVLEEKLAMDGLDWNTDTFKNQAYNLRMGRMDLLRQHVAYKSQAILDLVDKADAGARFYMIGDNAESDAYIYTGIKLLLDGRLTPQGYSAYLQIAGVEAPVAEDLMRRAVQGRGARVEAILIRRVPGYADVVASPLTDAAQGFDDFFQAALILVAQGLIDVRRLSSLARAFHNQHGLPLIVVCAALEAYRERHMDDEQEVLEALSVLRPGRGAAPMREHAQGRDPVSALRASLALDLGPFGKLSEEQILTHARDWIAKLHAAKEERKSR